MRCEILGSYQQVLDAFQMHQLINGLGIGVRLVRSVRIGDGVPSAWGRQQSGYLEGLDLLLHFIDLAIMNVSIAAINDLTDTINGG